MPHEQEARVPLVSAVNTPLTFHGTDRYFRESFCGNYRISKMIAYGVERYVAWRRGDRDWQVISPSLETVEEARAACELDRDRTAVAA